MLSIIAWGACACLDKAVEPFAELDAVCEPEPALLHPNKVTTQRRPVRVGRGFVGAKSGVLETLADLLTQTTQHNTTLFAFYRALRR